VDGAGCAAVIDAGSALPDTSEPRPWPFAPDAGAACPSAERAARAAWVAGVEAGVVTTEVDPLGAEDGAAAPVDGAAERLTGAVTDGDCTVEEDGAPSATVRAGETRAVET